MTEIGEAGEQVRNLLSTQVTKAVFSILSPSTRMPPYRQQPFTVLNAFLVTLLTLSPLLVNASALERLFAPKSDLWNIWLAHDASSHGNIDHKSWDEFLKNNIKENHDGITRIAYANLSGTDRNALHSYIESMQAVRISDFNRDEQLAYWINLYNAVTVDIILTHYPVKSIRDIDISPGLFADGPWGKKLLNIEGKKLSLNDVEHRILRPVWKDARVHYAVNCASLGCPNLRPHAYTADSVDEQLDVAAREYIAHPRGVSFTDKGIYVSSIYSWFQQDFGDNEVDVIKHIQNYMDIDSANSLGSLESITGYNYDWSLNDASDKQP